jgi:hypothetical protein
MSAVLYSHKVGGIARKLNAVIIFFRLDNHLIITNNVRGCDCRLDNKKSVCLLIEHCKKITCTRYVCSTASANRLSKSVVHHTFIGKKFLLIKILLLLIV